MPMLRDTKAGQKAEEFRLAAVVHIDALYRLALCATGNENDAQELVRNAYLRAYKSFDESEIRFSFKVWLFWVLNDIIMKAIRQHGEDLQVSSLQEAEEQGTEPLGYDAIPAMSDLPARYGIAVLLADVEGLSHKEIAYITGCSEKTVAYRLCKGRLLFRKRLQNQDLRGLDVAAG